MKTFKQILKWYLIGITFAALMVAMFIMVTSLQQNVSGINVHLTNTPKIILTLGAFFGIIAFAGFGPRK
jgi:hypothetical protein